MTCARIFSIESQMMIMKSRILHTIIDFIIPISSSGSAMIFSRRQIQFLSTLSTCLELVQCKPLL